MNEADHRVLQLQMRNDWYYPQLEKGRKIHIRDSKSSDNRISYIESPVKEKA